MDRVAVSRSHDIGPCGMDGTVDRERRLVEGPVPLDDPALVVDQYQITDADLPETHPERVDPEMIGDLWISCRDVPCEAFFEPEVAEESEGGRQALLAVATLVLDGVKAREGWRKALTRHSTSLLRRR